MPLALILLFLVSSLAMAAPQEAKTFCNPLNLDYAHGQPGARHAADPVIVPFQGKYYLFTTWDLAGYRVSDDLIDWRPILFDKAILPLVTADNDFYCAPAVASDGEFLYFIKMIARKGEKKVAVMRTREPLTGKWEECGRIRPVKDPCLFIDDDGRFYVYHGLNAPTSCFELDRKTFTEIPGSDRVVRPNALDLATVTGGFERGRRELVDEVDTSAWLGKFKILPCQEGAWMTKHNGRYYLQYATPGTVTHWYCDAVLEGPSPLGPFTYCDYAPASMKVGGFIGSAGHSCVFQDFHGNWWRVTTTWVGVDGLFERRLGLFPVGFDAQGRMYTETALGDLPQVMPIAARNSHASPLAGWGVQSYGKKVTVSSALDGHAPELAADENVRTWWSAASGKAGEWLTMDLGQSRQVNALQVNFAEQDCGKDKASLAEDYHHYKLLASYDGKAWRLLAERGADRRCAPHDYLELAKPARIRFLKIENVHMARGGKFALRDLRVFGPGEGKAPAAPQEVKAQRHAGDDRNVTFSWRPAQGADGYLVRYGVAPDALYQCIQVQGGVQSRLTVHTLNRGVKYWCRVDAFNGSGLTMGEIIPMESSSKQALGSPTIP